MHNYWSFFLYFPQSSRSFATYFYYENAYKLDLKFLDKLFTFQILTVPNNKLQNCKNYHVFSKEYKKIVSTQPKKNESYYFLKENYAIGKKLIQKYLQNETENKFFRFKVLT